MRIVSKFHDYYDISLGLGHDFISLIFSKCNYCGIEGSMSTYPRQGEDRKWIEHNGIDRVENNKGYSKENCITACKFCNSAKNTRTRQEFLDWAKSVYTNMELDKLA